MEREASKEKMNIVIVGHVDHGKSTIIGRLLADTHSLPEGKLEQVKTNCERNSKPFEYAFLIDALKDEQAQGITIDSARVFFKTKNRHYLIMDAPGHIEFLKNMVTGASRAEAALLVIDAHEGVQENSRRHGYMLSMLGIKQVAILVNKMDLMGYQEEDFQRIVEEYTQFLTHLNLDSSCYIPVSGLVGDNIASSSPRMSWYEGPTVLEILDRFNKESLPVDKPFRMAVQDVYKFTNFGDQRRIIAGTIETGTIRPGDEIIFFPSGKKSHVRTIEFFNSAQKEAETAGYTVGFTLQEQIYIPRGEVATKTNESRPEVTSRLRVNLFWLGKGPMVKENEYLLKIGTAKVPAYLEEIHRVMDASDLHLLDQKDRIDRHDVAECNLKLKRPIAFDLAEEIAATGRFVIVDHYEISGGGIIREALEDEQTWIRDKVLLRDTKWEYSMLSQEQRAEKYNQKSSLILITGEKDSGKKPIAKRLEAELFSEGKFIYFLGIGNVLYGVDADIKGKNDQRKEHLRRLAEVAHILLDAGAILIVTAIELTQEDLEMIKTTIHSDKIETIWIGKNVTTDILYDLRIEEGKNLEGTVARIKGMLHEKGILSKPLNNSDPAS
ncbi:MAG: adenylyl-sulfate kinase [Deltaproteobacteria bacterium RBG_16_48_10]|nr:MAG: adenylyl-sulfate kinase [Deltaproteobacteria bacterium RBG_16_48_10]